MQLHVACFCLKLHKIRHFYIDTFYHLYFQLFQKSTYRQNKTGILLGRSTATKECNNKHNRSNNHQNYGRTPETVAEKVGIMIVR